MAICPKSEAPKVALKMWYSNISTTNWYADTQPHDIMQQKAKFTSQIMKFDKIYILQFHAIQLHLLKIPWNSKELF